MLERCRGRACTSLDAYAYCGDGFIEKDFLGNAVVFSPNLLLAEISIKLVAVFKKFVPRGGL